MGRSLKGKERATDLICLQKEGYLLLVCSVSRDSVALTHHCSYSKSGLLMGCLVYAAISVGDLGTGRVRNGGRTGPRLALLFRVAHVLAGPRHLLPHCLCLKRAFPALSNQMVAFLGGIHKTHLSDGGNGGDWSWPQEMSHALRKKI